MSTLEDISVNVFISKIRDDFKKAETDIKQAVFNRIEQSELWLRKYKIARYSKLLRSKFNCPEYFILKKLRKNKFK